MGKYRKKPIVIEAYQMTKANRWDNSTWPDWLHDAWNKDASEGAVWPDLDPQNLVCGTLEGVHKIDLNDWIIQGIKGEICACKPDIFYLTYEEVVDDDTHHDP